MKSRQSFERLNLSRLQNKGVAEMSNLTKASEIYPTIIVMTGPGKALAV